MFQTVNRKIGFVLILFSIFFLVLCYQLPTFPFVIPVDADLVPKLLGFLLMFLSIVLFFSKDGDTEEQRKKRKIEKKELYVLLGVLFQLLVYILFFELLGFLMMTTAFIISCSIFLGYKKWTTVIVTAVVFSVSIYLLFNYVLAVNLPSGILPF